MATRRGTDGSGRLRRLGIGLAAVSVASLVVAGCSGKGFQVERLGGGPTEVRQSTATSAATVVAEEIGFLTAVRPSRDVIARVAGIPSADDGVLLFLGYAVCKHATQSGNPWSQIEQNTASIGGGSESEASRVSLLVVRAARANICG